MKSFKDYLDNKNIVVNEKVQNGLASVKKTLKSLALQYKEIIGHMSIDDNISDQDIRELDRLYKEIEVLKKKLK